jgi:hypothetical protein
MMYGAVDTIHFGHGTVATATSAWFRIVVCSELMMVNRNFFSHYRSPDGFGSSQHHLERYFITDANLNLNLLISSLYYY